MKPNVCALISKFGPTAYSITMLYGNAESTLCPQDASGIMDENVALLACKLTQQLPVPNGEIRNYTFFYDNRSSGSLQKATSTKLTATGIPDNKNLILAYMDNVNAKVLATMLNAIQSAAMNADGKFSYCGIHLPVAVPVSK